MGFHGRQPQGQKRGDLLVRAPFGQEMQDLLFAVGQKVVRITQPAFLQRANVILDKQGGHGCAEVVPAGRHGAEGGEQILVGRIFQQIGADTKRV